MTMNCCSGDDLLTHLLEEQLDQAQAAPIITHVESCHSCQERLKQLTSESYHFLKWRYLGASVSALEHASAPGLTDTPSLEHPLTPGSSDARFRGPSPGGGFPTIDGYEFQTELGHGGMGVVYKARQDRLSRLVAVKMIRAGNLAKPEDLARFRIEAETVANPPRQHHPDL